MNSATLSDPLMCYKAIYISALGHCRKKISETFLHLTLTVHEPDPENLHIITT